MSGDKKNLTREITKNRNADVKSFIDTLTTIPNVKSTGKRGRLLFGMDATASRGPTWDAACQIQGNMFAETAKIGGVDIQLAYYRGFNEFACSSYVSSASDLIEFMSKVYCRGGHTQLQRMLKYARHEKVKNKIDAFVFVGDCLEESVDDVCAVAGELGMLGLPCFTFQEGSDFIASDAFREVARLSGGAYCRFDSSSPNQLKELLSAVAIYAAGGRKALKDYGVKRGGDVKQIAHQVLKGR